MAEPLDIAPEALAALDAEAAARQAAELDRPIHCAGVTLWKRPTARAFLTPRGGPAPRFHGSLDRAIAAARRGGGRVAFWAARSADDAAAACARAGAPAWAVEDGFLRSIGLGQELRAPASLFFDPLGAHYDPRAPSSLERLIAAGPASPALAARAERFAAALRAARLSKYVLPGAAPAPRAPSDAPVALVVGQVADDASLRLGAPGLTNADLLRAARAARPDAHLIWRPHPDVAAGYRPGAVPPEVAALADQAAPAAAAADLLEQADEVWTLTSLMGFEALLRGKRVVCLGWPFYAGWGLTEDRGAPPPSLPARRARRARPIDLIAAAYLAYPRYVDPVAGGPCSAERVLTRLATARADLGRPRNPAIRAAAWARGRLARLRRR